MRKHYFLTILSLCLGLVSYSQHDVFNRSDSNTGEWDSVNNPWFYAETNNNYNYRNPDNDGTVRHYVKIGHNNYTTMITNGRYFKFFSLDFQASASTPRTINNSGGGLSASNGIYNLSSATHTINTPIGIDGATVNLHANSTGGFSFTDNIFINANTVNFGGSGSGNISHSTGTISGTGALTKSGTNTLTLSGTNSYSGATTVSGGTLVLNSSIASSAITVQSGATLQISSNATVSSLTVDAGGIVIVDAGVGLTVANDLVNNGTSFTINSGGSLIVNGTSDAIVTYNRELTFVSGNTNGWHLVASPVGGVTFNDSFVSGNNIAFSSGNNRGVATYNTSSNDWTYLQSGGSIASTAGLGYSMKRASTGNVSFTGTINTGDINGVTVSTAGSGFNLLGNPYTSFMSSQTFLNANTNTTGEIWTWAHGSGYTARTAVQNFVLAPAQGFFVDVESGTTVDFSESNQATTGGTFQRTTIPEIQLLLSKGDDQRTADVLYYDENTTTGFDWGYEGKLFGGITHTLAIYSHLISNDEGVKYQVQALPNNDLENMVIPVGVIADAGKITFSAEATNLPAGYKVFLEDKETGNFIRLDEPGAEYTVDLASASNDIGRFFLHTKTSALSTGDIELSNVSAYLSGANNLRVVGIQNGTTQMRLFNILGKQVVNTSFEASGVNDIVLPNLRQGVYIVQVASAQGTINKKIVIE